MPRLMQLPLWTPLGRPYSPEAETRDMRVAILEHQAAMWHPVYGLPVPWEPGPACCCGARLRVAVAPCGTREVLPIAFCRECGWHMEVWAE